MQSGTKFWRADRIRILKDFARQVADGLWEKVPYEIWCGLAYNKSSVMLIKRKLGPDGNFDYTAAVSSNGVFEDFSYTFKVSENSFGAYLDNFFGSPALSYQSEAEQNMSYNENKLTYKFEDINNCFNDTTTHTHSGVPLGSYYVCGSDTAATSYPYKSETGNHYTSNKGPRDDKDDVRGLWEGRIDENNKKESQKMNTSSPFNFDFGPASSNQFRMSPYGLAVRTQANGWVTYDPKTGDLMDVDILNFDVSKMIYKMPVALAAIKPGDILMHSDKPVFVREVSAGGSGTVRVIDYANAAVADILPVKSPFGFNFFTKICPLFNFDQTSANADNPFGSVLPFLMLNGERDGSFDPTPLFMASIANGGNIDFANNPMMTYFLLSRQDKGDLLPFLLMMNGGQMMFGNPPANTAHAPAPEDTTSTTSK